MKIRRAHMLAALAALVLTLTADTRLNAQFGGPPSPDSAFSIPTTQVMQPEALVKLLAAKGAAKPLVLQVGSRMLFAQAHIAGSEYAGPGSQPAGLEVLKNRVSALPRTAAIVIYCGCCPWTRCPNLGPAYKLLHDLGFTNVKALYLANNLGDDWVAKGYPVASGR